MSTAVLVFGILSDQMSYRAAAMDCIRETGMLTGVKRQQHQTTQAEPDSAILFYFILKEHILFYVYGRQLQLATF